MGGVRDSAWEVEAKKKVALSEVLNQRCQDLTWLAKAFHSWASDLEKVR